MQLILSQPIIRPKACGEVWVVGALMAVRLLAGSFAEACQTKTSIKVALAGIGSSGEGGKPVASGLAAATESRSAARVSRGSKRSGVHTALRRRNDLQQPNGKMTDRERNDMAASDVIDSLIRSRHENIST